MPLLIVYLYVHFKEREKRDSRAERSEGSGSALPTEKRSAVVKISS